MPCLLLTCSRGVQGIGLVLVLLGDSRHDRRKGIIILVSFSFLFKQLLLSKALSSVPRLLAVTVAQAAAQADSNSSAFGSSPLFRVLEVLTGSVSRLRRMALPHPASLGIPNLAVGLPNTAQADVKAVMLTQLCLLLRGCNRAPCQFKHWWVLPQLLL